MKKVLGLGLSLCMCVSLLAGMPMNGVKAYADGGVVLKLHYHRADSDYSPWSVWFWDEGKDGSDNPFADENGEMVATYEPSPGTVNVGFIVRTQDWGKDIDEDQFIDISEMVSGTVDVYVESGVKGYEKKYGDDAVKGTKLKNAKYDGSNTITVTMTGEIEGDLGEAFEMQELDMVFTCSDVSYAGDYVYEISTDKLDLTRNYYIMYEGQGYKVIMPDFYSTKEFEEKYTYTGNDLGATWTKDSTTFRVWAPTAESVSLKFYENGDDRVSNLKEEIPMEQAENGTWVVTVEGDQSGRYYKYSALVDGRTRDTVDPYARTTGANGARAMVIDLASTNPEGWEEDKNPHAGEGINDAVIYEAHIRDLTVEDGAGFEHKGKYLGVAEAGTATASGIPTGIGHMKDLGITHLHILPFYDFGSVDENKTVTGLYNWGYDPVNYNVPEGSYSTDASDGAVRVKEAKEMIKALHDNGISVVMDVVYNHVYDASSFSVNKLVPNYFSRTTPEGTNSNGSGCGNDTASERAMVRKFIVDSVNYWADEYHIDGFRFDLVGLIDVDTINEIVETVHATHPDVLFYGEGWSMSTLPTKENVTLATQKNSELTPGFAYFNDTIRDGIKGSVFDTGKGFVSGATGFAPKIERCFFGADSWCKSPAQTINYASCHDNNTLYDRLKVSCPDASEAEIISMNKLAAAIYMTSEGTPFMQAGEEMLRSKENADGTYNSNSYNAGDDVNTIKYSSLEDETVNDVYEYYKGLIAFRKAHKALRLSDAETVANVVKKVNGYDDDCLVFEVDGSIVEGETAKKLLVVFNATEETKEIVLPDGDWDVNVNGDKAGTDVLETVSGSVTVPSKTACVLTYGNVVAAIEGDAPNKTGAALIIALTAALALAIAGFFKIIKK